MEEATTISATQTFNRKAIVCIYMMILGTMALSSSLIFYEPIEPTLPRPGEAPARSQPGPSPMPILASILLLRSATRRRS